MSVTTYGPAELIVYVIHSADFERDSHTVRHMESRIAPFLESGRFGGLIQTEADESYDFNYLADEMGGGDDHPYWNGQHRKWAGELTYAQWRAFADAYCIDIGEDGVTPERYTETGGSITEYGHLPAVSVDDTEGWGDWSSPNGGVIDSNVYVSIGEIGPATTTNKEGN